MEAFVGKDVKITNFTNSALKFFEKILVFDNPDYWKKVRLNKWVGNTPQKISLFQRQGNDLILPFGVLPLIFRFKNEFEGIHSLFTEPVERFSYGSNIIPYNYQEKAILSALKARQGVIVAPCGSGKTMIGLEIAARLGLRTLWLTHTSDLLNQSKERAQCVFGLSGKDYGTITGGKVDIGKVLTFATVQTMSKLDLSKIEDLFDVVIVDECHHVVGSPTKVMMFYQVISSLKARYKFGLTATPKRADGLTNCMYALLGEKICEIDKSEVTEKTCPVKVKIQKTNFVPNLDKILASDGTIVFTKFISNICEDSERNLQIAQDAVNCEGTCLILTDRVAHTQMLRKLIADAGVSCIALSATAAKSERKNVLSKLNAKEVKIVIATYALAKEGLDVPTLNNLIFATPQKNETIITQSAGRVARKADGKEFGMIIDYEDDFNVLKSWQTKRNRLYKKLDFEILCS